MSTPTTYCGTIYNLTSADYNVVNQDRNGQSMGIPAGGVSTFQDTQIFAWCSNSDEIQKNGFIFRKGNTTAGQGDGAFFMFMNPGTNLIQFSRFTPGVPPAFPGTNASPLRSRIVNVRILPGDTPIVDRVER